MHYLAQRYQQLHGDKAISQFVTDLMRGDADTLSAGYSRENAIIAAAEAFEVDRGLVLDHLSKYPLGFTIKFNADGVDTYIRVLSALAGFTVKGEWTNDGFPTDCAIVKADDEGVTICEVDDTGSMYQANSTWLVGYDEIKSITVL
jgi:hypothetical protein